MADRPARSGTGLPETEIEITPEMIEAGVRAFYLYDRGDPAEWIVWAVFVEMEKARHAKA